MRDDDEDCLMSWVLSFLSNVVEDSVVTGKSLKSFDEFQTEGSLREFGLCSLEVAYKLKNMLLFVAAC